MKLYYVPGACSLSPHIVMREAGIAVDLIKVDLAARITADGSDYSAINPKGQVPALKLDDGSLMTEGPAIVQYLADQRPQSGLAPPPADRARYVLQSWLNFIATEVHKQYAPLFNPACTADQRESALANLKRRYDYLDAELTARDYLAGDRFSIADAYLFTVNNWSNFVGVDMTPWPAIGAYQQRIGARPAVQEALRAEGLLS